MKNSLVARILEQLADYTEMEDDQPYRARAYRRASQTIDNMAEDVEKVWKEGKLQDIHGVGENIEKKIDEILRTGKLETLEKIRQRTPVDLLELVKVEGVGPKTVQSLYKQLGIRNLEELEAAVRAGRLRDFKGLGVKTSQQLLERIESAKLQKNRVLLVQAKYLVDRVLEQVSKIPKIKRYEVAGSYRRMKETIGDLDVLIETDSPADSIDYFTRGSEVKEVIAAGESKASVKLENNFQVDVRVISPQSWGAALLYFTGSKAHNIELRTLAIRAGLHLNEYGLYREEGQQMIAGASEEEVYRALGLDYIAPELRENRGEIAAAQSHTLPMLIEPKDIRGDLQMHTFWSDGHEDIRTMAEASRKLGYEYIAITDHVGLLKIANALDESRIKSQAGEIQKLNDEYEKSGVDFHVLHGAEVNIRSDGRLDMPDGVLKKLDFVLASIHSGFNDDFEKMTSRILGAIENENVDILAHPFGRLIMERSGYRFDFPKVIQKAIDTETMLEMDAYPNRLDLSDENAREALKARCLLCIDTDSHRSSELEYMQLGVAQARRAWAEKKDILNTRSYKDLLRYLGN